MGIDPRDPEIAEIIEIKARKLAGKSGFSVSDKPDLEQEQRKHLWENRDKLIPQPANKKTFANAVLQNVIRNLIEANTAKKRDRRGDIELDAAPERSLIRGAEDVERLSTQMDVTEVLALLPKELLPVAQALMQFTPTEAARELGLTRGQIRHRMKLIAMHFQSCGIFFDSSGHPARNSCQ